MPTFMINSYFLSYKMGIKIRYNNYIYIYDNYTKTLNVSVFLSPHVYVTKQINQIIKLT